MNRAIANIQARVKRLEDSLTKTDDLGKLSLSSLSLAREDVDLSANNLPDGCIESSPILGALYGSEDKALTKFCIGTWPDASQVERSVAIHGGTRTLEGGPNEHSRMVLIPKCALPRNQYRIPTQNPFQLFLKIKIEHHPDFPNHSSNPESNCHSPEINIAPFNPNADSSIRESHSLTSKSTKNSTQTSQR